MVNSHFGPSAMAQNLQFIKALAGNDPKIRKRTLRNMKKWFKCRNSSKPFTQEDFMYIWKGLFYAMWMSDKPLVQEECAESIANLLHSFDAEVSLFFFKCGLRVISYEWFGIDQLRLDKFLMLVRRILRQAMYVLKLNNWNSELVSEFNNTMLDAVLARNNDKYLGLTMHTTEIYLEELAKVSEGEISPNLVTRLLEPFIKYLSHLMDKRQINHTKKFLFYHLLRQSDEAMDYHAKFVAWKNLGFPTGSMECMSKEESMDYDVDDEDDKGDEEDGKAENRVLDPRAGQVDVILPQLKFDAAGMSKLFHQYKIKSKESSTTARKYLTKLAIDFERMSKGDYPLGLKRISLPNKDGYSTKLKKAVNRMAEFEKKLLAEDNKVPKKFKKQSNKKSITKVVKRKRHSLDSNLVKKSFINLEKKVKIDLKLNKSQEIHEHHAQLLSSPAIPYDASKKPVKPLLKRNSICGPINPFYKL